MNDKERWVIFGGELLTPAPAPAYTAILIEEGKIASLLSAPPAIEPRESALDATGLYIAPGFIDIQINGAYGYDFTTRPTDISHVALQLPQTGVTAFLPTIVTSSPKTYQDALDTLSTTDQPNAAQVLGLHFEGPYINPLYAGAHAPAFIQQPMNANLTEWLSFPRLKMLTLAPELPGSDTLIRAAHQAGIVISAGHSNATYEQAIGAFDAGVRCVTHVFNAMRSFHHREPGLVGAALDDARVTVTIIPDGIHLHPAVIRLVRQIKGPTGIALITDAMAAMGQPADVYTLAGRSVFVDPAHGARLADGTLAGSILSMDQAIRNLMTFTGCSLTDALVTASTTPANLLGLGKCKGRLAPSYDADIVLLTRDLRVAATFVKGHLAYRSPMV